MTKVGPRLGRRLLAVLIFHCISISVLFAQTNLFGDLELGQYAVGFKQIDADQIKISVWYPTDKSDLAPLTFANYLNQNKLNNSELSRLLSGKISGNPELFPADSMEMLLKSSMEAVPNAEELRGRFPAILWSSRNETIEYQALISEFLSSHGFIVAFAESVPATPFPWQIVKSS